MTDRSVVLERSLHGSIPGVLIVTQRIFGNASKSYVQASPFSIEVRVMPGDLQYAFNCLHCGNHIPVQLGSILKQGRYLDGVNNPTVLHQDRPKPDIESLLQPDVARFFPAGFSCVLPGDSPDDLGIKLSVLTFSFGYENCSHSSPYFGKISLAFRFVKDPDYCWSGLSSQNLADDINCHLNRWENERLLGCQLGQWVNRNSCPGYDAERAFAPQEEVFQRRPNRPSGNRFDIQQIAIGQHNLHAQHHILDFPVFRGELPGCPRGNPATQGGAVKRLRDIAC